MALKGLLRDTSKGWSFEVQPPGIKANSELAAANRSWMSSTVSTERVHHQKNLPTLSILDSDLSNPLLHQVTIHLAFFLNTIQSVYIGMTKIMYACKYRNAVKRANLTWEQ